ncbi:MAG: hypothetical protein SXA11_23820 [Cyanobacteriota bacterium]|nr:hypothetical protein [Cyanobacteriota bacterium]
MHPHLIFHTNTHTGDRTHTLEQVFLDNYGFSKGFSLEPAISPPTLRLKTIFKKSIFTAIQCQPTNFIVKMPIFQHFLF